MKASTWILAGSVGLNVLAAAWWLRPAAVPPAAVPVAEMSVGTGEAAPTQAGRETRKSAGARGGRRATWADLASPDLKEWIRRLRAAQCPEETVQDIILAEVNRRFQARTRALWPERSKPEQYWVVQKSDAATMQENRRKTVANREIMQEKSALLVDLFGFDPEKQRRLEDGTPAFLDWNERKIQFIPEERRGPVLKLLQEMDDKRQAIYDENRGFMGGADMRASQRKLEAETLQGLSQLLSPQELREYELRSSSVASQLASDLRFVDVSREEYERIFDLRKKYGDSIYNFGDTMTATSGREAEANKTAMYAELTSTLGTDRVRELKRSQDYNYQQLATLATRAELPANTASKVYDFKEAAEEAARLLRENTALAPQDRQTALIQLRAETEKAVRDALGEKNYQRYQTSGGYWINSIAPPVRPAQVVRRLPAE